MERKQGIQLDILKIMEQLSLDKNKLADAIQQANLIKSSAK